MKVGDTLGLDTNLMIKNITLEKERIGSFDKYPFNVDIIKNFNELNLIHQ